VTTTVTDDAAGQQSPMRANFTRPGPPREIAAGVFWLGGCSDTGAWRGKWAKEKQRRHVYTNAYLIIGSKRSLLVESGHSAHWDGISAHLDQALGDRPLDFVFPSHQEIPHCGNLGRLAEKYPELSVVGDVSEYDLYYPNIARASLQPTGPGDRIDLGGIEVEFLPAIWHDLPRTHWLWAAGPEALFCIDGLQFSHDHWANDCGKVSDELSAVPAGAFIEVPAHDTIKWAVYSDMQGLGEQFVRLVEQRQPRLFAPTHGAPIVGDSIPLVPLIQNILDTIEIMSRPPAPDSSGVPGVGGGGG